MGKYEPLRKCLADQVPQIGELAMTFTEIERLVGPLPRSARSHQSWWSNGSETRTHTRAWRQAGWRVQADQAKQRVVFTRDTRTAVVTRPAETSSREEQLLRWGVICGLTVAAAVAAGISGVVGVTHLPLPALAILSAAAGGVSFTAGQAIAFHEEVGSARNWWLTSTLLLLLTFIGAFAYHLSFDPAMRAPLAYQFFVNGDETDVIPLYGEPGGPAQLLARRRSMATLRTFRSDVVGTALAAAPSGREQPADTTLLVDRESGRIPSSVVGGWVNLHELSDEFAAEPPKIEQASP
jgi:hypothetical protein